MCMGGEKKAVSKFKHFSVRIKNSRCAAYRSPNSFTLARTFKTVWGTYLSDGSKLLIGVHLADIIIVDANAVITLTIL